VSEQMCVCVCVCVSVCLSGIPDDAVCFFAAVSNKFSDRLPLNERATFDSVRHVATRRISSKPTANYIFGRNGFKQYKKMGSRCPAIPSLSTACFPSNNTHTKHNIDLTVSLTFQT